MHKSVKYFSAAVLFLSLLFSGCTAKKEPDPLGQKSYPSWYIDPPKTTASTLYALGEGENRDEAVKNALNMMASTLSVSISSQYDSKKVVQEGLINTHHSTVLSATQSDVKKIRIGSYELVESHKLGFKNHIVLISSDKEKLFDSLKNELDQKFTLVDSQMASLALHHALYRLGGYKIVKEDIKDIPDTLVVMNVLNGSYDGSEYLQKIERVNSLYEKLLSGISVEIECDNDSKVLEASIREGFSFKGVRIKKESGEAHFIIRVSSGVKEASSFGFAIACFAIDISVEDFKGTIVASNKLNIDGHSTQGYAVAKENAAIKLGEMIKKEGIYKITGLDI